MGEGFSIDIKGARELEAKLLRLGKAAGGKVVRKSVRTGAKVVQKAVKENAKAIVGGEMGRLLKLATTVRAAKKRKRGAASVNVMLKDKPEFRHKAKSGLRRRGATVGKGDYYIPAAIEYGHGNAAAIPFMRRGWDESARRALDKVIRTLNTEIELAARKA